MRRVLVLIAIALSGCASPASLAPDEPAPGWHTQIMPYIWVPSVSGSSTDPEDPDEAEDVDGASVLDYLDGVFMFSAETGPAEGPLRVGVDSAWVSFEKQRTASEFGLDAAIAEFHVLGRIPAPVDIDAYVGGRYIDAEVGATLTRSTSSVGADWWDPLVGLRVGTPRGEALRGWFSADVGGFGVGSDLSFELQAEVAWMFHDNLALAAGWRLLDVDYDQQGFQLDVRLHGYYVGLEVSF